MAVLKANNKAIESIINYFNFKYLIVLLLKKIVLSHAYEYCSQGFMIISVGIIYF